MNRRIWQVNNLNKSKNLLGEKIVAICKLCGQDTDSIAHLAEQTLIEFIKKKNPGWVESDGACEKCIAYYNELDKAVVIEDRGFSAD